MKRQKRTCSKSIYFAIAVLTLLVAAGIASYAAAPAGSATHGTLYTDIIRSLSAGFVTTTEPLHTDGGIITRTTGASSYGIAATTSLNYPAIAGVQTSPTATGEGVVGMGATGNEGKLGTASAGVEGTTTSGSGYGVKGTSTTGGGIYAQSTNNVGLTAVSSGGYAIMASSANSNGIVSGTSSPAFFAGQFIGGRGLYASKIEFGSTAFSATNGYLLLGIPQDGVSCTSVCATHGLICAAAVPIQPGVVNCNSNGVGTVARNCWCD